MAVWIGGVAAQAAPLDLKHVAAEAKWLGHVDVDAIRESTVVQKAWKKHLEMDKQAEQRLGMLKQFTGLDLTQDIHGLTFYGKAVGKHEGVLVAHVKLDQGRILGMAAKLPGHAEAEHGSLKLHSWTFKVHGESKTIAAAFLEENRLVIASGVDDLKAALDVISGKSPSLAADGPLGGKIPAGATVLFRATGISEAKLPFRDPVAQQTKSFRFVAGEANGESFFRARGEYTNGDVVDQLKEIVEGARALGRLHNANNPVGNNLINGLKVKADGTKLTILWKASAVDVWTMTDAHLKIFAEHAKKWREHHKGRHGCPLCDKACEKCQGGKPEGQKSEGEKKDGDKKSPDDEF